jgi:hypothetical protein
MRGKICEAALRPELGEKAKAKRSHQISAGKRRMALILNDPRFLLLSTSDPATPFVLRRRRKSLSPTDQKSPFSNLLGQEKFTLQTMSSRGASPARGLSIKQQAAQLTRGVFHHIGLRMMVVFASIVFTVTVCTSIDRFFPCLLRTACVFCGVFFFKSTPFGPNGLAHSEAFGFVLSFIAMTFFIMSSTWPAFLMSVLSSFVIAVFCLTL